MGSSDHSGEVLNLSDVLEFLARWRRTIGGTVLLLTSAIAAWTLQQPQVFQARATLMLREVQSPAAALSGMGGLSSTPPSAREIALLGSRSLAEQVVDSPAEWGQWDALEAPVAQNGVQATLGLTTQVWPRDRVSYARLLRGAPQPHRLHARYEALTATCPYELIISFPSPGRVRIGTPGLTGLRAEVELDLVPGAPLDYGGGVLWLEPVGAFVGRSYRVRSLGRDSAVRDLMAHTQVREVGRNSGVLEVTVTDGDPYRAADAANALVHNYLGWTVNIEGRAATQTMTFLDAELERIEVLLEQAEGDLLEVAGENARGLNITESAAAIIERLSDYEAERTRMELARVALGEAALRVREGELEALSRLPVALPDTLTNSYVLAIGELLTAAAQLERSDAGPYKSLLQVRMTELEAWGERSRLQAERLRRLVRSLEEDPMQGVAMYASATGEEQVDVLAAYHLEQLTELDTEITTLQQVATEAHPDLATLQSTRADLLEQARRDFTNQLSGLESAIADQAQLVSSWRARIDDWPMQERARLDEALEDLTQQVVGHLDSRIAGLDDQLGSLDHSVGRAEDELAALPAAEQALADAMRRRETYAGIVRVLLGARQTAQLQEAAALPAAVVVDPAVPILTPSGPGLLPNLIMGAVLALMLGTGIAWLLHAVRGFVATAAELEDVTGLTSLGSLPNLARGRWLKRGPAAGFAPVRDRPESPEAEVFRALRDSLEFASDPSRPLRTFAVCSSIPGEGKTTTNVNLALAFAADGKRVLLVDADLRRGMVSTYFTECTGRTGLREALEDTPWQTVVQYTRYPGLEVMLTGARAKRSSVDALRGDEVTRMVAEMARDYDLVIFDVPPVLALSDVPGFLAGLDGTLLLTRAHHVPRQALASTADALRRARAEVLGTVLNGAGSIERMYAYGYHVESASPEPQKATWAG